MPVPTPLIRRLALLVTPARPVTPVLLAILMAGVLAGCVTHLAPPGPPIEPAHETADAFVMPDGMRLPYRAWLPSGQPVAVMLALHGMNDSRDAWEFPAPDFAAAGIAVFSPDQRGFGNTAARGYWPGTQALVDDIRQMAALLQARYPHTRLVLLGESMGAAELMCLATAPDPPDHATYVLVSPAVWTRSEMNPFERAGLWLMSHLLPGFTVTGQAAHVLASDNRAALIRLSTDPLTIHDTRFELDRRAGGPDGCGGGGGTPPRRAGIGHVRGQGRGDPAESRGPRLASPAAPAGAGVLPRGLSPDAARP